MRHGCKALFTIPLFGITTMHMALEITARLAEAFPGDPCKGDFALYGLGIDEE